MHADAYPQPADPRADGMGRAVTYAIGLHVLFALVLWLSTQFSWERKTASAAGLPVIEASLDASASEMRAAERALQHVPEPMPQPIEEEVAEEDSVPPPQPIPEPVPDDSPVPQQTQAQERIPVPDTENQDAASRDAISQEKALREQEAKRRQEQLDLTERKRQEEAEKKQRLARQQEEADRKKIADDKKLADESGTLQITVAKTAPPAGNDYFIDALSGATLTSRGVDNLVRFWMGDRGFGPFLKNLKAGEIE